MKHATFDRGYEVQELPDGGIRFSGKGAGLGVGGMILMGILSLFVSMPLSFYFTFYFLDELVWVMWTLTAVISVGIVFILQRLKQPAFRFELTSGGVVHKGRIYKADEISEIFIDNPNLKDQKMASGSGLILGGSGVSGITLASMAGASNALASGLVDGSVSLGARVNYRVNIRHGKRVRRLATCLREDVALCLFNDLTGGNQPG